MRIPLKRDTFEQLIPTVATGAQYAYYWGTWRDVLKQLLVSVVAGLVVSLVVAIAEGFLKSLLFLMAIAAAFYWLWGPIGWGSWRNAQYRRYAYAGLWQGEVLDVYVTEELLGTEETVNKRGELVIVENRERRLNLEVGDEEGYYTTIQAPLQRNHKSIRRGDLVEAIAVSRQPNLSKIAQLSDMYLPQRDLWVSEYPYLRRDFFLEVRNAILEQPRRPRRAPRREYEYYDEYYEEY